MNSIWIWMAITATAVVTFTATGTVVVLIRRFTDRARKGLAAKGFAKQRTTAADKPAKRNARFNLTRQLHTAVAKRLPRQVLFQVIINRLESSRLPLANARKEQLVRSLANVQHALCEFRKAAAALQCEEKKLARTKRLLLKRSHNRVSVATQTPKFVQPPVVVSKRRIRFKLDYKMLTTVHKRISVRRFIRYLVAYMAAYFQLLKTPFVAIMRYLEHPNLLYKLARTVENLRLMKIDPIVNMAEEKITLKFLVLPKQDTDQR